MGFTKDKAKLEGILLGNLLVNGDPLVDGDYISLGQLYAQLHVDSRVHFDMPRLMKVISLDIYKGFVKWGFNGHSSEVMLHLTQKGRVEAAIRIKENRAWLPEGYEKPDDVEDIADQYCVGMVLPPVNDFLYSTKVLEEYVKTTKDSKPTSGDNVPSEGINSAKEGTTTPRTVVFCGDVAFWADTREELTSEEYKDILGITEKDLADLSKGCDGEDFDCMEDY